MQQCRRCGFDQTVESKFCSKCGAIHPIEEKFFKANKEMLIDIALDTKDYEWFKNLTMGVIADAE
jgi:uncharacterized membrane protein YvbJ